MTLTLRVLEATDVVCIVGSGIPGGQYLGSCDLSTWAYNCIRYSCRQVWFVKHVFQDGNLATKPSSRDDGLVARLPS